MNQAIIFGRRPIEELLRTKKSRVQTLYVRYGIKWSLEDLTFETKIKKEVLDHDQFEKKEKELGIKNSQGLIAVINAAGPLGFEQLLEREVQGNKRILVALDQVQDPHNLGALFRVCEAVGVMGIFYPENRSASVTPVVRKVSAGATEFLAYSEVKNLARSLEICKKKGYLIYGTSLEDSSVSLYESVFSEPLVVVFGSEGDGLRRQTKELCDQFIKIPMTGSIQSLNVSTSASAVLFEIKRKLGGF